MKMNIFLKQLTLSMGIALGIATFRGSAQTFDYSTKSINAYDHNGNLLSSLVAPDVSYIEVQDLKFLPETFSVGNADFKMIPIVGTNNYSLGTSAITWKSENHFIIKTFFLGETEVTTGLWKAVMGSLPSNVTDETGTLPICNVNIEDICGEGKFLEKLNTLLKDQLDNMEFCLPTEAEWEYAARGGNQRKGYTYSGSNNIDDVAWYAGNEEKPGTSGKVAHPVKTTPLPNELGLYDMSGNVYEWCSDTPYRWSNGTVESGRNPMRGGSWNTTADPCRNIARDSYASINRSPSVGFRLALKEKTSTTDKFSITGDDGVTVQFAMIPLEGTKSFRLKGGINWPEEERYFAVKDFEIGETEVTNALWKAVMGTLPQKVSTSNTGDGEDNVTTYITNQEAAYPAVNVSWKDICEPGGFLEKLNAKMQEDPEMVKLLNGRKFYLPTEAEWEFAASGGNRNDEFTYSGSDYIDEVAWYKTNSAYQDYSGEVTAYTHEVKTKKANGLGVYDMSGNVWEWCSNNPHRFSNVNNPTDPTNYRTMRGGSWFSTSAACPTSYRESQTSDSRSPSVGFRLVLK